MLLQQLLDTIPADAEYRVRRTRDRFNQNIREALRQETALRFRPKTRAGDLQSTELISVPIQLVPGLPEILDRRKIEEANRIAALLAPWKNTLEQLSVAAYEARQLIQEVNVQHPADADEHLAGARLFAEQLLERMRKFHLARWILEVDRDVLGAYFFCVPPDPEDLFAPRREQHAAPERQDSHIELYWAVIGLIAQILGVDIDDLTVVVLAHELAHAYTHRAQDIDGKSWDNKGFAKSAHDLKEGLAQYYTAQVCDRLAVPLPNAKAAYETLLRFQPQAYHAQEAWLENHKPEEVRFALVAARREGIVEKKRFESCLELAKYRLRSRE